MKISIEADYLIYIYLLDSLNDRFVATISNVNGYLIHDESGHWVGFRVEKSEGEERDPIELPPLVDIPFPIVETEQFIELLFTEKAVPASYYEQECHLDVANGKIVGIEIILYDKNPKGKLKWVTPFLRSFYI